MTPPDTKNLSGLNDFQNRARQVDETLKSLGQTAQDSAHQMDDAFARAGERMALSLMRAAKDGKLSLNELIGLILRATELMAAAQNGAQSPRPSGLDNLGSAFLQNPTAPISVNFHLSGGADSILRSQAQIATQVRRAIALGGRL